LHVAILEARDRTGGRVYTLYPSRPDSLVEAGAEFVHGDFPELDEAIEQSGAAVEEVEELHHLFIDGPVQSLQFDTIWQPISDRLTNYDGPDLSFEQFMRKYCSDISPLDQSLARSYVEGFNAADIRDVSVYWLRLADQSLGEGGGTLRRVSNGFGRIVDYLTKEVIERGVEIKLGTMVTDLVWETGRVRVQTRSGESITASQAIITVPLGVLNDRRSIRFVPDLIDKRRHWQRLKMGAVVKCVFRFSERFWPKEIVFLHTPDKVFETWWSWANGTITGWVGGPRAAKLADHDTLAVRDAALDVLVDAFDTPFHRVQLLLRGWNLFDWQADPFSRGAYMYVPVGQSGVPDRLAGPVQETLFFAGEATELKFAGNVGGAMASGTRVADQCLASAPTVLKEPRKK
jgi:monoamine oxidase